VIEPTAVIADDEAHLLAHLRTKLLLLWPELKIVAQSANGLEAKAAIEKFKPSVAFLDIKMPGLSGLEVARELEGEFELKTRFVFVTAYDEFALEAFEREAIDFLVKPVADDRLVRTIKRLRAAFDAATPAPDLANVLKQLMSAAGVDKAATPAATSATTTGRLRWLRASIADTTVHIPVQDIVYVQSDDKYTIVYTAGAEHVVRMPIAEMIASLDPEQFWQIHRSTIVNMNFVQGTRRDETSRLFVRLRSIEKELPVSRAWVHLFKQM
jgi:DNA-binding LytR/AlgR family response regulator